MLFQQVVPIYAAHLYDAVMVFARAVTAIISSNDTGIDSGRVIVSKIQRSTFKSEFWPTSKAIFIISNNTKKKHDTL